MFDKLKKAFSSAAKGIGQRELTQKVLDDTLFDLQMSLLESDVAQEAVDALSTRLKKELLGLKLEKNDDTTKIIQSRLQKAVAEVFARAGRLDLVKKIKEKKDSRSGPFVIVFLGINGTGKTTTVAKVANLLKKEGFTVVVAAGDTHRAGAIEQLAQHANKLSLKVVAQRYGADPSAVGRDAVEHARKNYLDVVLVDTAGRMQTSKNLMDEMSKILRVVKPDLKLFVGDALAGNDTINQAREFFQYTNFDGALLTKIDADAKGGAAISIAQITSKPIVYVGTGQGYDDIIPFDPDKFIESLFGSSAEVKVEDLMSLPKAAQPADTEKAVAESEPLPQQIKEEKLEEEPLAKPAVISTSRAGIFESTKEPKVKNSQRLSPPKVIEPAKKKVGGGSEKMKPDLPEEAPPGITSKPSDVLTEAPSLEEPKKAHPDRTEQPEQGDKRSRFGGFFKKKSDDERRKEEDDKRKHSEQREREEEERTKAEQEEEEKQKEEKAKKKRKEDKETDEDKIIYLTDEDIEDLLK